MEADSAPGEVTSDVKQRSFCWPPESQPGNYLPARSRVPSHRPVQSKPWDGRHLDHRPWLCSIRIPPRATPRPKPLSAIANENPGQFPAHSSIRSWIPPYQFFVTRMPINFGSVRNTLVVSPLSSLFRKSPVIAVSLKTFLS